MWDLPLVALPESWELGYARHPKTSATLKWG
jgi:hypothetical protein